MDLAACSSRTTTVYSSSWNWSRDRELNPRPTRYECVLTIYWSWIRQACPLLAQFGKAKFHFLKIIKWSRLPDLNRPPAVYDTAALPDELSRLGAGNPGRKDFVSLRGRREFYLPPFGATDGNRTHVSTLGRSHTTIVLRSLIKWRRTSPSLNLGRLALTTVRYPQVNLE